jgi:protein Hikeshi
MSDAPITGDVHALLGISIETIASATAHCGSLPATGIANAQSQPYAPSGAVTKSMDPTALAEKIVKHLFNYLSSFVSGGSGLSPETYVPLAVITKWYENFLGKVKAGGIGFLERDD